MFDSKQGKVMLEYDSVPIRHIIVQCPECKKWFYLNHILSYDSSEISYDYQLSKATSCFCPICENSFIADTENAEEKEFDQMPHICVKKTTWE